MLTGRLAGSRLDRIFAVLAFVAIALVLLRPICAGFVASAAAASLPAMEASHGSSFGDDAPGPEQRERCCDATIDDGALVKPSGVIVVGLGAANVPSAPATARPLDVGGPSRRAIAASSAFPLPSYYARSARILR